MTPLYKFSRQLSAIYHIGEKCRSQQKAFKATKNIIDKYSYYLPENYDPDGSYPLVAVSGYDWMWFGLTVLRNNHFQIKITLKFSENPVSL